jgi:hypothetical protein
VGDELAPNIWEIEVDGFLNMFLLFSECVDVI